jgi:hypothetical protein
MVNHANELLADVLACSICRPPMIVTESNAARFFLDDIDRMFAAHGDARKTTRDALAHDFYS